MASPVEKVASKTEVKIPEYKITESKKIKGVFLIERAPSPDDRGFFREVWRESLLAERGLDFRPIQFNHSESKTGVIRGIHAEKWDKLVYPITGKMWVPVVDLRPESETFGQYEGYLFDCTEGKFPEKALFLPNGTGNSICAIKGPVHYLYLVDAYWTPDSSFAIDPFDKDLDIPWPVENPVIHPKDLAAPSLRERFPEKFK